jgi:tRNA-dihydrouridine synthase B
MAGLTHTAFRRLVHGFGGIGLYATEMLSARALPQEHSSSPYLLRTASEQPLSYQLLVSAPEEVGPAVEALHALGADAVDLNMGCPAPDAKKRGGGCRLMEDPQLARAVVAEARKSTELPLTVKLRLGPALEEAPLRHFCRMLEGEGVELITVHARLSGEPYGRRPRWEWIGKVKSWVEVPVVGNGGIFTLEDARRCLDLSGCDGLMIGRGAAVRPWLPAELASALCRSPAPPNQDLRAIYDRFQTLVDESFPPERRLGRLKEFTHYFGQNYAFGHTLASAVQSSRSPAEAAARAAAFFAAVEEPS